MAANESETNGMPCGDYGWRVASRVANPRILLINKRVQRPAKPWTPVRFRAPPPNNCILRACSRLILTASLSLRYCKGFAILKGFAMSTATVTSKGQITIPATVRERLGLASGDRVEFVEFAPGEFALKLATEDVRSLKGMIQRPARPVSLGAMNAAIRRRGSGR
jgi:antitoxin PrlF